MLKNRRLRWAVIPVAVTLSVVLAGCTQAQLHGYLPGFVEGEAPVTNNTERVAGLWTTSWIVLLIVGLITWGLTLWAVIVYRRRKGQTGLPVQLRYNMPIEIFYTIVPLILVLGFFAFTARDQNAIEARFEEPEVQIEVLGKQWAWDFNYVTDDVFTQGIQGQANPDGEPGSLVESELPTLVLPVGKKIEIALESRDVIHSFWVIDFLYKKDMIPGKTNYMSVIPERIERTPESALSSAANTTPSCCSTSRSSPRPTIRTTSTPCAPRATTVRSLTSTTAIRINRAPASRRLRKKTRP